MTNISDPALYQAVGRMEGKIDVLLSNQSRFDKRLDEQESRLMALETSQTSQRGMIKGAHLVAMAISAVVSFAAPYLKGLFLG